MKRLSQWLFAMIFGLAAWPSLAQTDYTDSWWMPAESGWGVNLTQQGSFIFATFFVYGQDGRATWFTAQMLRDGTAERFTGALYRTTGTWFGAPVWQGNTTTPVGTATFTATSAYTGTLTYSVDGLQITKSIERLSFPPVNISGSYSGAVAGTHSGCEVNGSFTDFIDFEVVHSTATGELRIDQFSSSTGRLVCRMQGNAIPSGKLLLIDAASYVCEDFGWNHPARVYNIRATPTGFEAQWFSDGGNGCSEWGDMSGVFFR